MIRLISFSTILLMLVFTPIAPVLAGEGDDEIEPNDSRALADVIDGFYIDGHMDEDDGDDWFVLEGQEGVYPVFTIFFDDEELEVDFEIYSDDEVVGTALDWGSGERLTCEVPGVCYVHVWWWDGEGDYTIRVSISNKECAGEDEIEPNDEEDLADWIDGLEINGFICEDDYDWYVLDGQEGFEPTFTLIFDDEDFEIDYEIYSDDELVEGAYGYGSPDTVTCDVPGRCYILVYFWEGEGEYTIEIEP